MAAAKKPMRVYILLFEGRGRGSIAWPVFARRKPGAERAFRDLVEAGDIHPETAEELGRVFEGEGWRGRFCVGGPWDIPSDGGVIQNVSRLKNQLLG